MPPDAMAAALARKAAAQTKFGDRTTDTGLGDALAQTAPTPVNRVSEQVNEPPKSNHKPVEAYQDADGTIHAQKGARASGEAPKNEIDFRAWRAKGRNAAIHTKVRPEFRKMFYQGAAKEEKELCVVLEEMILERYGRKR